MTVTQLAVILFRIAAVAVIVFLAVEIGRRALHYRKLLRAQKRVDEFRARFPQIAAEWDDGYNDHDIVSNLRRGYGPPITGEAADRESIIAKRTTRALQSDEPLAKPMPNMGGIGNPPYQGPNYVEEEEMADYMKRVMHFFPDPKISLSQVERGDLSWEFEAGHVAPDGTIWIAPGERATSGTVRIPWREQAKAARFGWEFTCKDVADPEFVHVARPVTKL